MNEDQRSEMIALVNQAVEALNANDRTRASELVVEWKNRYLLNNELLTENLDAMKTVSSLCSILGYPEFSRHLSQYVGTESPDLNDIAFHLQPMGPGVMVDVGAQWGTVLMPFLWAGWRVLAFEPDVGCQERMLQTMHGFKNFCIDPRAVSGAESKSALLYCGKDSNVRSLHGHHEVDGNTAGGNEVEVTTLGTAFKNHNIRHVTYLKIDIEGEELPALQAMPWDRVRPMVIATEFDNPITRKLGYTVDDLAEYLKDQGYRIVVSEWEPIVSYGVEHQWRRYTLDVGEVAPDAWGNVIAFVDDINFNRFCVKRHIGN